MRTGPRFRGYGLAVSLVLVLTGVKLLTGDDLGRAPLFLYPVALIAVGWFGTAKSALFATGLSVLAGWYFYLRTDEPTGVRAVLPLLALAIEGVAITAFVVRLRAAHRAAEAARQQAARVQTLTAALAAARTPEDIADIIVEQGKHLLGAAASTVSVPCSATELEIVAQRGLSDADLATYRIHAIAAELPSSVAFRTGKPQFVETPSELARRFGALVAPDPARAALAALPLVNDHGVLGVIGFRFSEPRCFSSDERTLLETFALQAAQALERAERYKQEVALRRRLEDLEILTERLSEAMTREQVAEVVVDHGMRSARADTCALYILEESGRALELVAHRGIAGAIIERIQRVELGSNDPAARMLETGEPMWAENEQEYAAYYPRIARLPVDGQRARAFWNVPLTAEGRPFGMLAMGYYQPRRFGDGERTFVATFTRHCAEALRRAERYGAEGRARLTAERLQASLSTTLRSIGDAVIATDVDGRITLMNSVAETLLGLSEGQAQGRPLREVFRLVHAETRLVLGDPVERVLRDRAVIGLGGPTLLLSRDGREIPIDDSGAPIRALDGSITGVVLVFRDVSHKQRDEHRREFLAGASSLLAESLDHEATLSHVAELIVPKLADWCAIDVLEPGERRPKRLAVAHVDPEKLRLARELGQRYAPDLEAARGVGAVLRTGRPELYREIVPSMLEQVAVDAEHLTALRGLGMVSAMLVPLVARGQVLGVMSFVHAESGRRYDATDLEFAEDLARRCASAVDNARLYAAEQQARRAADVANRAKDEFLATVSHELRTPLNAILGWAKMLSAAPLDEAKRARAIATIERNSVAMAQLIEDLLDVSRIISGKMRLEMQPLDPSRVLDAAVESVRPAAEAKGVQLEVSAPPVSEPLLADPPRLQQVIWNLLSNAVKFTPSGGKVSAVVRREGGTTQIRVTDDGSGIAHEFLPRVFEPFSQEHVASGRTRGGLGLGLAITRQLVELHGGRIEAQSDGHGRGASFVVSLPSRAARDSGPEPERRSRVIRPAGQFERPPALAGLRVLVVDDDEDARQLVQGVLDECGSRVLAVDRVDAAFAALATSSFDVIVSDIGMPVLDGYDLIRKLRALPPSSGGRLPAVALTAYARAEDRRRALEAGYDRHLAKPVEPAELVQTLASLLSPSVAEARAARSSSEDVARSTIDQQWQR